MDKLTNEEKLDASLRKTLRSHKIYYLLTVLIIISALVLISILVLIGKFKKISDYKNKANRYIEIINNACNNVPGYYREKFDVACTNSNFDLYIPTFIVSGPNITAKAYSDEKNSGILYYYYDLSFMDSAANKVQGKTPTNIPQASIMSANKLDLCYRYENGEWIIVNNGYKLDKDIKYKNIVKDKNIVLTLMIVGITLDAILLAIYIVVLRKRIIVRRIVKRNEMPKKFCDNCGTKLFFDIYKCPNCGGRTFTMEKTDDIKDVD